MRIHERRRFGGLLLGLIVVGVGVYYLLTETFGIDLPEVDWDLAWPVVVIGIGLAIVYRALDRRAGADQA
jgi:hypothetical protein